MMMHKHTTFILYSLYSKETPFVVLADDDIDDCRLFSEAINEIAPKAKMILANSGDQLTSILKGNEVGVPDIIFLDLNMPSKNGYDCLKEIRETERTKTVPVVIYSTSNGKPDIDKTFDGGASLYLTKPHSFSDLKELLTKVFALDWSESGLSEKDKFIADLNSFPRSPESE